jgi:hypothetical protein
MSGVGLSIEHQLSQRVQPVVEGLRLEAKSKDRSYDYRINLLPQARARTTEIRDT